MKRATLIACAFVLVAIAMPSAFGQGGASAVTASSPDVGTAYVPTLTFDVAAIRESKPDPIRGFVVGGPNPPHASTLNLTNVFAMDLIEMAYGVDYSQISGGPDWLGSTRFNIQAKSDSSVDAQLAKLSNDQAKLEKQHMLQVLLADRFQLKVQQGTKEGTIYALVLAKNGPKFHETNPEVPNPDEAKNPSGIKLPPVYQRGDGRLGYEFIGYGASMKSFASMLSGPMVVLDKTGLTGAYDFTLQYHEPESNDPTKWPPIATALQEQLGLKLEPEKGSIPILVIDHIERPSPN